MLGCCWILTLGRLPCRLSVRGARCTDLESAKLTLGHCPKRRKLGCCMGAERSSSFSWHAVHGRGVCADVDDSHAYKAWVVPLPVVVLRACTDGLQAHQNPCPPAHLARPPDTLSRCALVPDPPCLPFFCDPPWYMVKDFSCGVALLNR